MPTDPGYRRVSAPVTRGVDTRIHNPDGSITSPRTGVTIGPTRYPGQGYPAAVTEPPGYWDAALTAGQNPAQPTTPGNLANRSGSGGGRGGGGGRAGPNPAQIRALGDELFKFNAGPWDLMRQQVGNQRTQAQGYNPDFGAYETQFNQGRAVRDQERAAAVAQQLQELAGFGQQLAGAQGTAMQGALRDLQAQGANVSPYLQQSNQIAGDRTAMLANQGQYQGQLGASATNASNQAGNMAGLIRQGGESTLANNRGSLLNTLSQQEAQIGMQQAQAQQQNEQARREFMLKYGVI